jgi:hypothetical protein
MDIQGTGSFAVLADARERWNPTAILLASGEGLPGGPSPCGSAAAATA